MKVLFLNSPQLVEEHFERAAPLLAQVIAEAAHGEFTIADLRAMALDGRVIVCIVEDDDGVRVAGAIEFKHYPQILALNIMAVAGRDFVDIAADLLAPLCEVGRAAGATVIEASCSPAMARLLAQYSFADTYRVVRLAL
jgi:hypothetical protein